MHRVNRPVGKHASTVAVHCQAGGAQTWPMRLLAGAVVDKLVGGSHGSQRMRAGADFLIERVGVEGVGCYVGHGHGHLKIFVAQFTHVVELVGEERKSILVGSSVYGDRSESESLLCLSAISCEPVFGEG